MEAPSSTFPGHPNAAPVAVAAAEADADASDDDRKPAAVEKKNSNGSDDDESKDAHDNGQEDDGDDPSNGPDDKNDSSDEDDDDDDNEQDSGDDQQEEDSEDDDDEDSEDDDEDDNDDDPASATHVTQDGRTLSHYEFLRQERIKRNKQYLTSLGLEGQGGGLGTAKSAAKPKAKKTKKAFSPSQKRSSLSRRTKTASVNYTEPSISVASLLRTIDGKKELSKKKEPKERVERKTKERMEKFVYLEFKSIQAFKKKVLVQAERNVRNSNKEIKYWKKRATIWERRQKRKQEQRKTVAQFVQERRDLGGGTAKKLLQEIDNRMPEILAAVERYDDVFEAAAKKREREMKRLENEHKMKMLDSLDRFPRAMKDAVSVLNAALLERTPKDPPPPRRSKRKDADETEDATPKKRTKKENGNSKKSEMGDTMRNLQTELVVTEEVDDSPTKEQSTKGRKRNARIVGGWVSPNFAAELDRAWLERDAAEDKFELSAYVPQVGDIILYYPDGHREYLDKYPDVLGKKTRSSTRVPLWERAASEKAKMEGTSDGEEIKASASTSAPKSWWCDDWLARVQRDLGRYPLVCRVERTHSEFPPDPYTKVVKKEKDSEEVKIYWKGPKDGLDLRKGQKPRLRLAVSLRPLTSLLPPIWDESGPSEAQLLVPPPVFSVVTFPSVLRPYLVPFAWAYSLSHSLSVDEKVLVGSKSDSKVRITSFASLEGKYGSSRLDDKIPSVASVLSAFYNKNEATQSILEKAVATSSLAFPLPEAFAALETLKNFMSCRQDQDASEALACVRSVQLVDLIRCTLPLWDSVSVMRDVYDRKRQQMSPWILQPSKSRLLSESSSRTFAEVSHSIDESLRVKLEYVLDDMATENESAELFYWPVTEDDAPGYGCAVPCSMSLDKILARLKADKAKNSRCFYRGVEGILSDINAILDNCLLYNSPESEVVVTALDLVSGLKSEVSRVAQNHFGEMKEARNADEKRRRFVMQSGTSGAGAGFSEKPIDIDMLRNPFKETLHREWLQTFRGDKARQTESEDASSHTWVPQPGDCVLYSSGLHQSFVKGHYKSLETHQCAVPPISEASEDSSGVGISEPDWFSGDIVWTRPSFPKAPSPKSDEDVATFTTNAPLMVLGVRFKDDTDQSTVRVVYWRPCSFSFEIPPGRTSSCCTCGVSCQTSFLQPAPTAPPGDSPTAEVNSKDQPGNLSDEEIQAIGRCFGLLKKRCLRDIPAGYIDPQLTKANVKQGYLPSLVRVGAKSTPSFADSFVAQQEQPSTGNTKAVVTRGFTIKPQDVDNSAAEKLTENGFLPPWVSPGSGNMDSELLERYGTILPCPKLSLELVQLRLKNGYYRDRAGVENDLVESYVCTVSMLLSESFSRKKSPISMRRVARSVSSVKWKAKEQSEGVTDGTASTCADDSSKNDTENVASNANPSVADRVLDEEAAWKDRLCRIRELYAVALLSVSETAHAERVLGLVGRPSLAPPDPVATSEPQQDPVQRDARQKLRYLLSAIGKDPLSESFRAKKADDIVYPPVEVSVVCNGKTVEYDRFVSTLTRATADMNGKTILVKIVCGGRPVTFEKTISPEADANSSEGNTKVVRVKAKSVMFEPDDYEGSDSLARVFFGSPGRMQPCARCQAYRRSLAVCRVRRGHSNSDFEWPTFFQGLRGIDGLLQALEGKNAVNNSITTTGAIENSTILSAAKGSDAGATEGAEQSGTPSLPVKALSETNDEGDREGAIVEDTVVDPLLALEQARLALVSAEELLKKVRPYAKAPARFSKEFVDTCFPIDESDHHYLYCVICGLSGDLLCCDGCSNVVHTHCISLKEVPEDDWFCEECVRKQAAAAGSSTARVESEISTDVEQPLPFGRLEFNNDPSDDLTLKLRAIRSTRPEKLRKNSAKGAKSDDEGDDAESQASGSEGEEELQDADDDAPRRRGRPRRVSQGAGSPLKSKRGRKPDHAARPESSPSRGREQPRRETAERETGSPRRRKRRGQNGAIKAPVQPTSSTRTGRLTKAPDRWSANMASAAVYTEEDLEDFEDSWSHDQQQQQRRPRRCKRCVRFGGALAGDCPGRSGLGQTACRYFDEAGKPFGGTAKKGRGKKKGHEPVQDFQSRGQQQRRPRRCKRCVSFGGALAEDCPGRTNLGQIACQHFTKAGKPLGGYTAAVSVDAQTGRGRKRQREPEQDLGMLAQNTRKITRSSRRTVKAAPTDDDDVSIVQSVTSESSIPQQRHRRTTKRLVDEIDAKPGNGRRKAAPRSSRKTVSTPAAQETRSLNVLAEVFGMADEPASDTRKRRLRRRS